MLRAARLAAGRKLELRVVPLPEGTDPADLIAQQGAEALRELVERSAPFVVFHVERILDRADTSSAEGRDRALTELRPVLAELPASVLREELLRRIAGRLELSSALLSSLAADSEHARGGGARAQRRTGQRRRAAGRPGGAGRASRSWSCASRCRPRASSCCPRSTPISC